MNDGRITEVKWDIPIYLLRGNTYENIGTINDIRRRGTFNNYITNANSINIGTLDELRTGRLFIRNSEEEKRTPTKLRGGKTRRRKSRKQRKQRKQRRTKKNKIHPVIYGGASIKQYGIASALRSLILTYFPQKRFAIINLYNSDGYDKYGLTTKYTTVMELLNQIVHNDDDRAVYPREIKFGDFLIYSQDLDNVLIDIISDIKQYFNEEKVYNKFTPQERDKIKYLINSIDRELEKNMGVVGEGLPKMIKAPEAEANKPEAAPENIAPKNPILEMLLAASSSLPKK